VDQDYFQGSKKDVSHNAAQAHESDHGRQGKQPDTPGAELQILQKRISEKNRKSKKPRPC
jgi:hypothetical protein